MSRHIESEWHENNTVRPQTMTIETVRCYTHWEYHSTMRLMMSSFLSYSLFKRMNVYVSLLLLLSCECVGVFACLLVLILSYRNIKWKMDEKLKLRRQRRIQIITKINGNSVSDQTEFKKTFSNNHIALYIFIAAQYTLLILKWTTVSECFVKRVEWRKKNPNTNIKNA